MKTTETHKFKKGQKLHLDQIYEIQGLAGGQWWDAPDCATSDESDEEITITEDIEIKITVTRKSNETSAAAGSERKDHE